MVEDRVVGGLNPDFMVITADPFELARGVFSAPQSFPEDFIVGTCGFCGIDEHAMVPTDDVFQMIAREFEEVFIGVKYFAVQIEFDDCLRPVDRLHFTDTVDALEFGSGDVIRLHDDFGQFSITPFERAEIGQKPAFFSSVPL